MIYLGIDDTDNAEGGGTGRVAREIAAVLAPDYPVTGVSRHQLLVDPRVPYTRNNSCNVIHLATRPEVAPALFERIPPLLVARCLEGSDPGLCVGGIDAAAHPFGRAAQTRLVTQAEAWDAAAGIGALLAGLGGTQDGLIGALAGVILAASGDDGRFVDVGGVRSLGGIVSIPALLAAGVAEVRTVGDEAVTEGRVDTRGGRVRPLLRGHRAVLLVEPDGTGEWQVVEAEGPLPMGKHRCRG